MPRKHTCTVSMDSIKHRCDVVSDEHHGPAATGRGCMTWKTCATCGAWLPLGPSNDDDERVKVEMRAARIGSEPPWGVVPDVTCDEIDGWRSFDHLSCDPNPGHYAGYLARCIATHTEDK